MRRDRAEVIVIGSGPGGAVTGTCCAEAGYSVLMLEEGPDLELDSAPHFSCDELLQKYRGGGVGLAFGRDPLAYVEGRCVGGGSEVNRGLYHRAPPELLERWSSEFKVRDLCEFSMARHFQLCESSARVEYLPGEPPASSARLRDGAAALGWKAVEARRLYSYGANGDGGRQTMSQTFIPRFRKAGGRILPNLRARRLRRMDGRWLVEAIETDGKKGGPRHSREIVADRIFVACGAVQTPALLRRSGLSRNIGNSLRFHPMLKLVAEFDEEINRIGEHDPVHQVKEFEPELGMGCSVATPATVALSLSSQIAGDRGADERDWRRMGIYYVQSTGGSARVRSIPFSLDPFVSVRFGDAEKRQLFEGLGLLAKLLFAAGARVLYPAIAGCPPLKSEADIAKLERLVSTGAGALTSVHVFSSCPMGEDLSRCATDSFGKIHGADGLYIADASLLCTPTSVNPQGTVMAVAHRNAEHAIRERFR
jgi:choline dehydrogenase-like flavoprotein